VRLFDLRIATGVSSPLVRSKKKRGAGRDEGVGKSKGNATE